MRTGHSFKNNQRGQGMTEYIIIVALVAVSAITVYNLFGDTVRSQVGGMTAELGGGEASSGAADAAGQAGATGDADFTLGDFKQDEASQ